jgi:hypothetical protein
MADQFKPEARHLIETPEHEYWCDDYILRNGMVECFRVVYKDPVDASKDVVENFIIYEIIQATHDYKPKINTLKKFQKIKRRDIKRARKDFAESKKIQEANAKIKADSASAPMMGVDAQ